MEINEIANKIEGLKRELEIESYSINRKKKKELTMQVWIEASLTAKTFDIGSSRDWVKKSELFNIFGYINNLSAKSSINDYFNLCSDMFDMTKIKGSAVVYVRLRKDLLKPNVLKSVNDKLLKEYNDKHSVPELVRHRNVIEYFCPHCEGILIPPE